MVLPGYKDECGIHKYGPADVYARNVYYYQLKDNKGNTARKYFQRGASRGMQGNRWEIDDPISRKKI